MSYQQIELIVFLLSRHFHKICNDQAVWRGLCRFHFSSTQVNKFRILSMTSVKILSLHNTACDHFAKQTFCMKFSHSSSDFSCSRIILDTWRILNDFQWESLLGLPKNSISIFALWSISVCLILVFLSTLLKYLFFIVITSWKGQQWICIRIGKTSTKDL